MTSLVDFGSYLSLLLQQRLPAISMVLLPASIAVAGAASLNARSDDRVLAWVQVITSLLLTAWMAYPWHPSDPNLIAMNLSVTLFTFGYVMQDWLREAWRSALTPRWAHRVVFASIALAIAALIYAAKTL